MTTPTPWPFAAPVRLARDSSIRELLKVTEQPGMISFAGGLPAPELFPVGRVRDATDAVLTREGQKALQYGRTEGHTPLREWIAADLTARGTPTRPEEVLIVSGSQQALDLVGRALIDPGTRVAIEAPTYLGALQAWRALVPRYTELHTDEHGVQPEAAAAAFEAGVRLMYVIPTFQNPSGRTLTADRRAELARLAGQHGAFIVEDDAYAALDFEGRRHTTLRALAPDRVIHLGTFSKTLSPGLRLGWIAAPAPVVRELVRVKQGLDLHTPSFTQMIALEVVQNGFLDTHLPILRRAYQERCTAMLAGLVDHFPAGTRWTTPTGGMFVWTQVPGPTDTTSLLARALGRGVAFVPGETFYPQGGGEQAMRLNFSNAPLTDLARGLRILGELSREAR